jgi:hypothetical protein
LLRILGSVPLLLSPTKSAVVTVGGSLPVYPNNQTNSVSAATAQKQPSDGQYLPLALDNALKRMPMFAGERDHLRRLCLSYFNALPAITRLR